MKYRNIREEELKNKVGQDFFGRFDCTEIIRDIDFAVKAPLNLPKGGKNLPQWEELEGAVYLLWAEAKQKPTDILVMLTQLVLTIGKARTFDKILPPHFLGCFDSEKIAFVPYADVQDIFYLNDFNWKVAPSDYETREFKQVYARMAKIINNDVPWETCLFDFEKDEKELKRFIRQNFVAGETETSKILIDKNNFITVYNKWLETVQPTIAVKWDKAKARGIISGDFYLADLLSAENKTLKEKLFVLLHGSRYEFDRIVDEDDFYNSKRAEFADNQQAHARFWAKYKRPPLEEYWDYIIERRDLLVPQDVRERKGSFFTPRIWVELSQKYLTDTLGKDWQDEYYVWDCAAGTGNLLAGLTNKYNIWASTLDKADVDVMKERIQNGANLLESHVFQFDFLNDDFSKLPKGLQDIINDPKQRKKLIIYINPPYAETATKDTANKDRINKRSVSFTKTQQAYANKIGIATKELFAQFLVRIFNEISGALLAQFSKLKIIQGPNFNKFRSFFKVEFQKGFAVPANTFDNVKGEFPIAFMIWKLNGEKKIEHINLDLYDKNSNPAGQKTFYAFDESTFITDWFRKYHTRIESQKNIGSIGLYGSDFQHNNFIRITSPDVHPNRWTFITAENLIASSIYFTVRKVIPATWLNDRDQFLYPNDGWQTDTEFQNDCLAYTLFNNNISSKYGVNHWIPFMEQEVDTRDKFDSHFMMSFISGKIIQNRYSDLFTQEEDVYCKKREFSLEAKNVFDAGRALWRYYHAQPLCDVNASLYDIREYFQGRNEKGLMNNRSDNETYNELIGTLRSALKELAKKIEPKVYEHGFLRE